MIDEEENEIIPCMYEEIIQNEKGIVSGELKIGIIPTLAPYLLPLFLKEFMQTYPLVKLVINEFTT